MPICKNCGELTPTVTSVCPSCNARGIEDRWAPPAAESAANRSEPAPFGYSASGRPRRISLLSKLSLILAALLPPVGLVLGIAATMASRRYKDRPGNRAVAISSIFTALHIGLTWGWVLFVAAIETGHERYDPLPGYDDLFDPFTQPPFDPAPVNVESSEELQRLLEQILSEQP